VLYTAVRATEGTKKHVALFKIVVAAPAEETKAAAEESGLFGNLVTYGIIAGVVVGIMVVFVV